MNKIVAILLALIVLTVFGYGAHLAYGEEQQYLRDCEEENSND